ncbi:MAG: hypothetical protein ABIL70_01230 [candidate division WOR-3 bacterium]
MVNRIIKLFLTILIFAVCSKKEEEPQVLEVVNISNTPGRSEHPAIAADSRGYFYVVWDDQTPDGKTAVYITQRPPGGNWTTPNYIINPQRMMRQPDIAVDKENTIHVVGQYTNPQGWFEIFYTKKPLGGDWSELEIIGMYGMACHPKIAVDNNGDVHIVWQELVGYWPVIYAKRTKDGSWSSPIEISKNMGEDNSVWEHRIAVDQSNDVHVIITQDVNYGSYPVLLLEYTTNSQGGTWIEPIVLCRDSLLDIGSSAQIVTIDNQNIYVIWAMRGDIFYTYKLSNSQWQIPARVCSTTAISGGPHIVAIGGTLQLIWTELPNMIPTIIYSKMESKNNWKKLQEWIFNSGTIYGAAGIAVSSSTIGIIIYGRPEDEPDNDEIYFGEIPIN